MYLVRHCTLRAAVFLSMLNPSTNQSRVAGQDRREILKVISRHSVSLIELTRMLTEREAKWLLHMGAEAVT